MGSGCSPGPVAPARAPSGASARGAAAVAVLLASVALPALAAGPGFAPRGTLGVVAMQDGGEAGVQDGEALPPGAGVVFDAEVDGASYLYLLLVREGEDATILWPPNAQVWMRRPGKMRVVPQPPTARPDDVPAETWTPEQGGPAEFVLVASPAPRATAQDSRTPSLEAFLLPPPYVRGPLAGHAVVLARMKVTFGQ